VLIQQKRAEIAAKVAAMQKSNALKLSSSATIVGSPSPATPPIKVPTPASGSASPAPGSKAESPSVAEDLGRKVAEAKRRVAEAQSKLAVKDNPYMVRKPSMRCQATKLIIIIVNASNGQE
jgi:U4/U6 small nuclear ribonucleoprotein PRP3